MNRFKRVTPFASAALLAFAVIHFSPASACAAETKSAAELDIEANIAVRFYNNYEPMLWTVRRLTNEVIQNIRDGNEAIRRADDRWLGFRSWRTILDTPSSEINEPVRVPNFFAKDDIKVLRDTSDALKKNIKDLAVANNALSSYFNEGDTAKADQFKKYIAAREGLVALIQKTIASLYAFNDPAIKLAQEGEARAFKTNPLGPIILHMREVLDVADQAPALVDIPSLISPSGSAPKNAERTKLANETADKLDALSAKVSEVLAKYKNDDTTKIDVLSNDSAKETMHRNFNRIYTDLGPDLVKELKEMSELLRERSVIQDTRRLGSIVGALTSEHDSFIQMYNNWTPEGDVALTRGENRSGSDD